MKKILILLGILIINNVLIAQNIPYFSTTSIEEYNELSNPISVNNGEIWDQGSNYTLYFDFNFTVFDQTFNSLNVNAGGGIDFPGYYSKDFKIYHTPFGGFLLRDKGVDHSISDIDYEVTGEEGKHIIKVQWKNAGFVQWFSTSDTSDFIDFQIWIFQEDAHFEFHFGDNQAGPGTYGYPEATNNPNPGPSIKFTYDDCSDVLSYYNSADNPSYNYYNMCQPNYSFVEGTPSKGVTYIITPNENYMGISENDLKRFTVFPNPANDVIHIELNDELSKIKSVYVIDIFGKIIHEFRKNEITNSILTFNIETIPPGIYFIKVISKDNSATEKFIKKRI